MNPNIPRRFLRKTIRMVKFCLFPSSFRSVKLLISLALLFDGKFSGSDISGMDFVC